MCQFDRMPGEMFFANAYELAKDDPLIVVTKNDRTFMLRRDSIAACSQIDE